MFWRVLILTLMLPLVSARAEPTNFSSYAAQMSELDMIRDAKDLTEEQQDEIIKIYRNAHKASVEFRAETAKVKSLLFKAFLQTKRNRDEEKRLKRRYSALKEKEWNSMVSAMERISEIVRQTNLDRDYLYRAILREHRRAIPGFQ